MMKFPSPNEGHVTLLKSVTKAIVSKHDTALHSMNADMALQKWVIYGKFPGMKLENFVTFWSFQHNMQHARESETVNETNEVVPSVDDFCW